MGAEPAGFKDGELQLTERSYPIQVNQKDKVGRPDIDAFQSAMRRSHRDKGFFVAFDYIEDALREIDRFLKADHAVIIPLTVPKILDAAMRNASALTSPESSSALCHRRGR